MKINCICNRTDCVAFSLPGLEKHEPRMEHFAQQHQTAWDLSLSPQKRKRYSPLQKASFTYFNAFFFQTRESAGVFRVDWCKQADPNSTEAQAQMRGNERLACLLCEGKLAAHSSKCSYVSI